MARPPRAAARVYGADLGRPGAKDDERTHLMRLRAGFLSLGLMMGMFVSGCGDDGETKPAVTTGPPLDDYLYAPISCAYQCPNSSCEEATKPYSCLAMGAWDKIAHYPECPAWDGKYPAVVSGKCAASEPSGDAVKRPGVDAMSGARILPDGRTVKTAGSEFNFNEPELSGSMTTGMVPIPGTPYVVVVDTGKDIHAVRVVDTGKIGVSDPVAGIVLFPPPMRLNSSLTFVAPNRVYVASDYGEIFALSADPVTGALSLDAAENLPLPMNGEEVYYVAGVAASPDGKKLVASGVETSNALVFDIDPASPSYKKLLGSVDIGDTEAFSVYFDPNDAAGQFAYVPIWRGTSVVEINVGNPAAPKVSRSFSAEKNPQGIAFLDARWMAVANDFGESISLIDRVSGASTSIPIEFEPGLKGLDVSYLAFDTAQSRLYVLLAALNAIAAYDVDLTKDPPVFTPKGRLSTSWWPSAAAVLGDGSLAVTSLRGKGIGPLLTPADIGDGDGDAQMRGAIQKIPAPTDADFTAGTQMVAESVAVGARPGYPKLTCADSAKDFPVPETNTEGPSPHLEHIIFIVRENKTFDSLFGDVPGMEGEPAYAMKSTPEEMDRIWTNFRELAKGFTVSDNFYNLAIKSTQGHQWTTYGRTTDFCERTWSLDSRVVPLCGVASPGKPVEGSLFDWLASQSVDYDILGEIVGVPAKAPPGKNPVDALYPGGPFQHIDYNDVEKSCYGAIRARVKCNLGSFVYMTLPNDHTIGLSPDNPTPELMCAVNDEATGMIVDAISHSPLWASSLIVITEDDPQQGGDHIDYHRTPLVLISPWVKRGYVSKTHIDVASLHKIFAHVLGLPYPNVIVKNAGLPLDMFTSTPDFTPYVYKPRTWPLECGTGATGAEQALTASWDFKNVDDQPGLSEQVMRWMRKKQLTELSPEMTREIEARKARRASGITGDDEDDD